MSAPAGTLGAAAVAADATPAWRLAAPWALRCVPLVPVTIVLHELGHLAAAAWLGFPDLVLHFGSIGYGDAAGIGPRAHSTVGFAGPAVTLLLAAGAAAWSARRPGAKWPLALLVTASSRFAVGLPYSVGSAVVLLTGNVRPPPAFDEHRAATALGWSGDAALAVTSLVVVAALVWISSALPPGDRRASWSGLLLGTAAGWALWMAALGPALLP